MDEQVAPSVQVDGHSDVGPGRKEVSNCARLWLREGTGPTVIVRTNIVLARRAIFIKAELEAVVSVQIDSIVFALAKFLLLAVNMSVFPDIRELSSLVVNTADFVKAVIVDDGKNEN